MREPLAFKIINYGLNAELFSVWPPLGFCITKEKHKHIMLR